MTRVIHMTEKTWGKKTGRKLSVSARIAQRKSKAVKVVAGKRCIDPVTIEVTDSNPAGRKRSESVTIGRGAQK